MRKLSRASPAVQASAGALVERDAASEGRLGYIGVHEAPFAFARCAAARGLRDRLEDRWKRCASRGRLARVARRHRVRAPPARHGHERVPRGRPVVGSARARRARGARRTSGRPHRARPEGGRALEGARTEGRAAALVRRRVRDARASRRQSDRASSRASSASSAIPAPASRSCSRRSPTSRTRTPRRRSCARSTRRFPTCRRASTRSHDSRCAPATSISRSRTRKRRPIPIRTGSRRSCSMRAACSSRARPTRASRSRRGSRPAPRGAGAATIRRAAVVGGQAARRGDATQRHSREKSRQPEAVRALAFLALTEQRLDEAKARFGELRGDPNYRPEAFYYLGRIAETEKDFLKRRARTLA